MVMFPSRQPTAHLADPARRLLERGSGLGHRAVWPKRSRPATLLLSRFGRKPCGASRDPPGSASKLAKPPPDQWPGTPPGSPVLQTPILDAAPALERAVIHLDPPASAIPVQPLAGIPKAFGLYRRQQHPIDRFFHLCRVVHFPRVHRPDAQGGMFTSCRGPEHHRGKTHFQLGGYEPGANRDGGRPPDSVPAIVSASIRAHSPAASSSCSTWRWRLRSARTSSPGPVRVLRRFLEQFIKVGFPIPDANQPGMRTKLLHLGHGPVAHQPLAAFLLFDRQLVAAMPLARLRRIARPALHVEQPQRRALAA